MSTVLRESILSGPCTKDEERFERTADLADGKDEKSWTYMRSATCASAFKCSPYKI